MGGAEAALLTLCRGLRDTEPQWPLELITAADGSLLERARDLGISVRALPFPPALARLGDAGGGTRPGLLLRLAIAIPGAARYRRRLRRAIAAIAPDIVHSNGLKMHFLAAAQTGRAPLLWHLHDYLSCRPLMRRLLCCERRRCAAAIAVSASVAEDARRVFGEKVALHTIHNAIDLDRFQPTGPIVDLDHLSGLPPAPPGTVRVGLLATFARWKGHEVFLEALARLVPPPAGPPVRGYVIGGPIYQTRGSQWRIEELRARAQALGLEDRVGFTGFIEDGAGALRALDIFVHSSTAPEPFGLAVAEAMACGRAVIISRSGGVVEIVREGEDALAHTSGAAKELAECIARLAADPALRRRLAAAARLAAEERFTPARMAAECALVYRKVFAGRA